MRFVVHSEELRIPVYPEMILSGNSDADLSHTENVPDDCKSDPNMKQVVHQNLTFHVNKILTI